MRNMIAFTVLLIGMLLPQEAYMSTMVPQKLSALSSASQIIVIGHVKQVQRLDEGLDRIQVEAVAFLKGKSNEHYFEIDIWWEGLKGFAPKMKVGDSAVFFLDSLQRGKAKLTFPSSIAQLTRGNWISK